MNAAVIKRQPIRCSDLLHYSLAERSQQIVKLHAFNDQRRLVGKMTAVISRDGSTVMDSDIFIGRDFRDQGYSRALVVAMLQEFPQIQRIKTSLQKDNFMIFQEGLLSGLSKSEAVIRTPSLRNYLRLGFTKVKIEKIDYVSVTIVLSRQPKGSESN